MDLGKSLSWLAPEFNVLSILSHGGGLMIIINNPLSWPIFPILPLTRGEELGILFAKLNRSAESIVYLCSIYDIGVKYKNRTELEASPQEKYLTFSELEVAGWRVD